MSEIDYSKRRQRVFFVLSGLFLGTLAMLNILGISRFLDMSFSIFGVNIPFAVAVGVLPYPVTFMCTDLISELFGEEKRKTWFGLACYSTSGSFFSICRRSFARSWCRPSIWRVLVDAAGRQHVFFEIRDLAFGAVTASMIAYLTAQFCDVKLFHFFKRLTKGKHLWLRNNASTLTSQLVDSVAVILVTYFLANALPVNSSEPLWPQLMVFILSNYVFKATVAAIDTPLIYFARAKLRPYLGLEDNEGSDRPLALYLAKIESSTAPLITEFFAANRSTSAISCGSIRRSNELIFAISGIISWGICSLSISVLVNPGLMHAVWMPVPARIPASCPHHSNKSVLTYRVTEAVGYGLLTER